MPLSCPASGEANQRDSFFAGVGIRTSHFLAEVSFPRAPVTPFLSPFFEGQKIIRARSGIQDNGRRNARCSATALVVTRSFRSDIFRKPSPACDEGVEAISLPRSRCFVSTNVPLIVLAVTLHLFSAISSQRSRPSAKNSS